MTHFTELLRRWALLATVSILGLGSTVGIHDLSAALAPCTPETTTIGDDTVVQFKNTGQCAWVVPALVTNVTYLVVAGGGGGSSGGGGGGGVLTNFGVSTLTVTPGASMSVTVGAGGQYGGGGSGNSNLSTSGGNSIFGTLTAVGGGHGGTNSFLPADGGSGGGGGFDNPGQRIAEGVFGQGNSGGRTDRGGYGAGGGGGGASAIGGNARDQHLGGNGGAGITTLITGASKSFGGGGGGGVNSNCGCDHPDSGGAGGLGGGGNGSTLGYGGGTAFNGTSGATNTGGGGGGTDPESTVAGNGGSGIVIVRYLTSDAPANSGLPVISGSKKTGETLTATTGTWTGSPSSYSYQWKRASTVGGTYSNIGSASSANSYELTDDDIDKFIKVAVVATNAFGPSSAALSDATSAIDDLPASVVPTTSTAVSTADGFTFTISNYSNVYTYTVTTTSGSVTRSVDEITVFGLGSGASVTVTVRAARTGYRSATKTVAGSATVATTTTVKAVVTIDIQAPVTTVAQGQASVATVAPTTTSPVSAATAQVAVTTTSVPASTTTVKAAPTTTTTVAPLQQSTASIAPPVIPKVSTGESALNVGGVSTKIDLTRENNQLVMKSGEMQATLSGLDDQGETRSLDADGNLRLAAGDVVKINVGGFEPGSDVDVWLFSTPRRLGTAVVGADGTVSGSFTIPKDIEDGAHRIAITTRLTNGKEATFTLGVAVGEIAKTSTLTRILIAIPITLAVGFGLVLPTQYRRRRKTLTA